MQREIASEILALMMEYSGKFDRSLSHVMNTCSNEEFLKYRKAVGWILGTMFVDIMTPIFKEHPDLEPESLRSTHEGRGKACNATSPSK